MMDLGIQSNTSHHFGIEGIAIALDALSRVFHNFFRISSIESSIGLDDVLKYWVKTTAIAA
ncbi:MAG: hypothetical protein VKJ02_14660 [Snowella sp.]|nr:hypothetical protein [Snowella sp.]